MDDIIPTEEELDLLRMLRNYRRMWPKSKWVELEIQETVQRLKGELDD